MFSHPWPAIKPLPRPQRSRPFEQGSCECGDVTIKVLGINFAQDGPRGKLCHCFRCRQMSASHYRHNLTVAAEDLVIEGSGACGLRSFLDDIGPGARSRAFFCSRCGCITSRDEETPGYYCVPLGLFDGTPHPMGEIVTWQKVGWLKDKIFLKELDEE